VDVPGKYEFHAVDRDGGFCVDINSHIDGVPILSAHHSARNYFAEFEVI
jgi:hypothetical protein